MDRSTTPVCLSVGCLTSQQHASVSQGWICPGNSTRCHTESEVADQTFYLTRSQHTDTGPASPSADPITPGSGMPILSHWYDPTRKNPHSATLLQERLIAMRLGSWISVRQYCTTKLPQGSLLFLSAHIVYTKGPTDLKSNGHTRVLTFADDALTYKEAKNTFSTVTAVQVLVEKVPQCCQVVGPAINPSKARSPWSTLHNK